MTWKRLLDNVWVLWRGSVDQLKFFLNYLNNCSEFLKFTLDFDSNRFSFLDLWIICESNTLHPDLFTEPTAPNSLLRADSRHPLPLKNSLPYSQFCRVKRICSRKSDFDKNMAEMKNKFSVRGYKSTHINGAVDQIITRPRSDLFQRKINNKKSSIIFSTKYSKTIWEYWCNYQKTLAHSPIGPQS